MSTPRLVEFRNQRGKAAIVFVHGFSGDAEKTWGEFTRFLMQEPRLSSWDVYGLGYSTSLRIDVPRLWAANPDLTVLSLSLRSALSAPPLSTYGSIALVAHSMGGLVAQHAMIDTPTATR